MNEWQALHRSKTVKQVTKCGHGIYSVASRLGVTHASFYAWIRRYGNQPGQHTTITDQQAEINRLYSVPLTPEKITIAVFNSSWDIMCTFTQTG